jgi:hypothetical protein
MDFTEQVMAAMRSHGLTVTLQYPGAVEIQVSPTETIWTGLNGWDYGTVNRLDADGTWQPAEHESAEISGDDWAFTDEDLADPEFLGRAWASIVERRQEPVQVAEHFHPGEYFGCREDHRQDHRA